MVNEYYKTTELGLIPSDWDILFLKGNFDFLQNNTYARDCLNPSKGDVQNIHYGDVLIKFGCVLDCDKEDIPFINPEIPVNFVKRLVQSGDIIIADTAEDNTVGKSTEVINVGDRKLVSGLHTVFIRPHMGLFAERFLGYFMNSLVYHDQLLPYIVGTKVSSVSKGSLLETVVLRPPLSEQHAIAATLSDVDGYIAALERLIAKKRNIKKGAMQELLTGKRRLPGCSGEWVEKKLGDMVISARSGGTPLTSVSSYYDGRIPFLSINDMTVQGKYLRYASNRISQEGLENSASWIVPVDSLIYSMYASVGFVSIAKIPMAISQAVLCLEFNNIYDSEFLYYLLSYIQPNVFKYVGEGTQKNLNAKAVKNFDLFIPAKQSEQTAIAAVLSDMDVEIDVLTAKLTKVRNIKQGMMQELLTGRIRLVDESADVAPAEKPVAKIIELPKREPESVAAHTVGHNQQFDDAVMIAGIVNALYSDKFPLGRKKVQKCLYLLRRHQDESTAAFKKKAAGPYADEVRYKGGEPIARNAKYITTAAGKQGTTFARGKDIGKALGYIQSWGRQADIKWLTDKLKFKKVDELELLATVDMAICDLEEAGTPISVAAIKHLIATNVEWKAKLKKQTFSDANIAKAIKELQTLL